MRLHATLVLFTFLACSKEPAVPPANPTPPAALAAPDDDCTWQTPLVPGIPGSPGNLIKSPRNPNGDSELADLMRKCVEDLRNARSLIDAGEPVPAMFSKHRKMRCAWPTKPDQRNQDFDTRAQGYLAAVRAFDADPSRANYNRIVDGCIHCHSNSCGGPLDFIDSMKWQ
ncbi:MAG: hypothetical protein WAT39_01475 [Planctomycetota bacterium]